MEQQAQSFAQLFGYALRRRRKALDLTQEALGKLVSCSGFAIRKIEADERRPSRHLAERLATALAIPEDERQAFLNSARAIRANDHLPPDPATPNTDATAATESTPLIGREVEYGLLIGLVARLTASSGATVLIEGEPGIGKSRLMREVVRYARAQTFATLSIQCFEIDRATPYQPVIDLAARALERAAPTALAKIPPVSLAELAALDPAVAERFPGLPQLSGDFPEARQARLARAVGQVVEACASGSPLILAIDDIQWADDASAQVLHYLARHTTSRAVLILYAYRDENLDDDEHFARLITSLRHETDARHIALKRLRQADAQALVASSGVIAHADTPRLAEQLHRETEGNPFFLMSILQSMSEGALSPDAHTDHGPVMLPDALRAAVRARILHVPPDIRATLEAAAVLGRRFDFDTLLGVARAPEEKLLDALDVLVKRRLLREEAQDGIYDFSHDKIREVVYLDIGGARRKLLHRAAAEAMEHHDEIEAHERDARLADHYERAQVWDKALGHLVRAGEKSQALFSMRDALHWFDRAVALSQAHPSALAAQERTALYERRGAARAHVGLTDGAVADIGRVIEAARANHDRIKTRDALIQLGMAYRRADAYEQADACLNEALTESRLMHDERHAADTLYHLGTVAWSTGRNHRAIECHQEAVEICERSQLTDLVAVQAYHGRGEAHFAYAEPAAAIRCYSRSIELALGIGDRSYESENLMMIGHACTGTKGLGDYPRAQASCETALAIAREADLQWHMGPTLLCLDHVRACTGDYGAAWSGMLKTLQWLENLKQVRYQFIAYDFIGHLLLDLGLNEQAVETMERGLALGRETRIDFWRVAIESHHAVAKSRLGESDVAAPLYAALERASRSSERYLISRCLEGLAEISIQAGDATQCRTHADELLALAQANGLRELVAAAHRWRGEAALARKNFPEAQTELSQAATLAKDIGRVRLHLDAENALARLYAKQRNNDLARRSAATAASIAASIQKSLVGCGLEAKLAPHT